MSEFSYSAGLSFDKAGIFTGWYGNLEAPFIRTSLGLDTRDYALDVVADAAGNWRWKDEEEFARRLELGTDSAAHQERVRTAGWDFIGRLGHHDWPFHAGWQNGEVSQGWMARALPEGWDADLETHERLSAHALRPLQLSDTRKTLSSLKLIADISLEAYIMLNFAISSWSVDGLLTSGLPLLDLPAAMKEQGLGTLELCHFHLPSTEPEYLTDFRAALTTSKVELFSLLIDTGDVASPDQAALTEGLATIRRYIEVAAALGAARVRISAGQQPATPATLAQSAARLTELMAYAEARGVKVSTENWQLTAQQPGDLLTILEAAPHGLGLCADTGNAEATPDKYETLQKLLPHATSVHFKARRQDGMIDEGDVRRCLELMQAASFEGPVSLIYDGKRDEWLELRALKAALGAAASAGAAPS